MVLVEDPAVDDICRHAMPRLRTIFERRLQ